MKFIPACLTILLLFFSVNSAADYFIRLTNKGLEKRSNLINRQFSQINALQKTGSPGTDKINFRSVINQSHHDELFLEWLQFQTVDNDGDSLLQIMLEDGIIDYAEPVGKFKVEPLSNDSLISEQWYLEKINIAAAWPITRGNPQVIIGVIDTGIDYRHPDLQKNIWINEAEKYGISGVDDDGNGFIDDSLGWDFTDAPRFPDGGDFKTPDNDPMDEFGSGHGTQIAGIIAATTDNGAGIAGIAPDVKVMNLRAGTAAGYLEEDDVARAIIYAIDNGARIINMSFGDVALSQFLRDVIYYAYQNKILMIASAGNSGTNETHFPSGLNETLAVTASTEDDNIAGFSNFGSSIDLAAPGVNMTSTAIGGGYNRVQGTSFSAPVVSAVAGLILSNNPGLDADRVRNILKTSASDILYSGWDIYSGSGRIDAGSALAVEQGGILGFSEPRANSSHAQDTLWISGSAVHPDIKSVQLMYGFSSEPDEWITLQDWQNQQIFDDTLAALDVATFPDTAITLRLRMQLINDATDEHRVSVKLDRTAPEISDVRITSLLDGMQDARLIEFNSDDICTARIIMRRTGASEFDIREHFGYQTDVQRLKLNQSAYPGSYEFYIEATNLSGLTTLADNNGRYFNFNMESRFRWTDFRKLDRELPAGYMLSEATDLDSDGHKEIVLSQYDDAFGFGPVRVYEFEQGRFIKKMETPFTAIPRDAGDFDKDGKSELLLGYGQLAFLLEAKNGSSFPDQLSWQDTTNFWAAAFGDFDGDGLGEIVGRNDFHYFIKEQQPDGSFVGTFTLTNSTTGDNQLGVPFVEISDLNNNGRPEIIYGDYDGDLIIYEASGDNQFNLLSTSRLFNKDATGTVSAGKNPQTSNLILAASHTAASLNYEHEFDARYWSIELLRLNNAQQIISLDTLHIYGYSETKNYDSGIKFSRFNDRDYLFAALYPDLYVIEVTDNALIPVWYTGRARSNTILVDDFDGDGLDEFYFNDGDKITAYGSVAQSRPLQPMAFKAAALDSQRAMLRWDAVSGAQLYNIYRGTHINGLQTIAYSFSSGYTDALLDLNQKYFYAVSAVDSGFAVSESPLSSLDSLTTSYPPKLTGVEIINERQAVLTFNEAVYFKDAAPAKIWTKRQHQYASSAVILKSEHEVLASFADRFNPGLQDTMLVENIFDQDGIPTDRKYRTIAFNYIHTGNEPYLAEFEVIDRYHVKLEFSEPMRTADLSETDNYFLEPSGHVEQATIGDSTNREVILKLSKQSMAGALGRAVYLTVENLHSEKGILLSESNRINLFKAAENLSQVIVYPQPLKPQHHKLTFANLPQNVQIKIFALNGRLVKSIEEDGSFGGIDWDLTDKYGRTVSSGVYIYELRNAREKKLGKIVIVR